MAKPANNTDRPVVDAAKTTVSIAIMAPVVLIVLLVVVATVALAASSVWVLAGVAVYGFYVFCRRYQHTPQQRAERTQARAEQAATVAAALRNIENT